MDNEYYQDEREFGESQINANLESDANLMPLVSLMATNTRATRSKVTSEFFGEQYNTLREDFSKNNESSDQLIEAQKMIEKNKMESLR